MKIINGEAYDKNDPWSRIVSRTRTNILTSLIFILGNSISENKTFIVFDFAIQIRCVVNVLFIILFVQFYEKKLDIL